MSGPHVRQPAVAGRFYPRDPLLLRQEVESRLGDVGRARPALGVLSPHAGYVYSGGVAGRTFARVLVPRRVVVLAPNHTGLGARVAVLARGAFQLPGALVPVDEELARALLDEAPVAREDWLAHEQEHAVEVELPFLLARQPALRVVPVVLGALSVAEAVGLGQALARAAERAAPGEDVLCVASSDMSHYLPDPETRARDRLALAPLLALDAPALLATVADEGISMCGVVPATVMLAYARARGARAAELVDYATSGDASGDRGRVVGYAGVVVT